MLMLNICNFKIIYWKITWFVFWMTGVIGEGRGLISMEGWTINGGAAVWWTELITGVTSACWTASPKW